MRDHKTDELKRHIGQVSCQSIFLCFLFIYLKKLLYNGNDAIVSEWVALPASHSIPLLFSIEFCMHVSLQLLHVGVRTLYFGIATRHDFHSFEISDEHPHTQSNHSFNLGFQKSQIEKKSPLLAIGKFDDSVNSFKLIVLLRVVCDFSSSSFIII